MIQRFHEVIERRNILQAKTFIEGSSKLSLRDFTEETIEGVETRGPECGPRCQRPSQVGKVRSEDLETAAPEVICENFKLIVLRPQLGNNNKGGRGQGEGTTIIFWECRKLTESLESQSCKYSGKN